MKNMRKIFSKYITRLIAENKILQTLVKIIQLSSFLSIYFKVIKYSWKFLVSFSALFSSTLFELTYWLGGIESAINFNLGLKDQFIFITIDYLSEFLSADYISKLYRLFNYKSLDNLTIQSPSDSVDHSSLFDKDQSWYVRYAYYAVIIASFTLTTYVAYNHADQVYSVFNTIISTLQSFFPGGGDNPGGAGGTTDPSLGNNTNANIPVIKSTFSNGSNTDIMSRIYGTFYPANAETSQINKDAVNLQEINLSDARSAANAMDAFSPDVSLSDNLSDSSVIPKGKGIVLPSDDSSSTKSSGSPTGAFNQNIRGIFKKS